VIRLLALACASLLLIALARATADESEEARLRARLSPDLAAPVIEIVRWAEAQGLPTLPLVARALEGASRQADSAAIVNAVRRHASGMAAARRALGPGARPAELDAGAGALLAGMPEDSLVGLKRARPTGSLTVPLIVLSDLMARGISPVNASGTVLSATRAGAADLALLQMRERINERIRRGEAPMGASREGLRELLSRTGPAAPKASSGRDPPERRQP
jgi:hypothetical protein